MTCHKITSAARMPESVIRYAAANDPCERASVIGVYLHVITTTAYRVRRTRVYMVGASVYPYNGG